MEDRRSHPVITARRNICLTYLHCVGQHIRVVSWTPRRLGTYQKGKKWIKSKLILVRKVCNPRGVGTRKKRRTRGFGCKRHDHKNPLSGQVIKVHDFFSQIYYVEFSSNGHHRPLLDCHLQNWCIHLLNFYLRSKLLWIIVPSSYWRGWESLFQRGGRYPRSLRPWGEGLHVAVPYSWPVLLKPCG